MKSIEILGLTILFVCLLSPFALGVESAQPMISLGGGAFAGMYAVSGDMLYHRPSFGWDDSYLRVRVAATDSQNLIPAREWRKFVSLCVDGITYFNDYFYAGCGLNYPVMVSDDETASLGEEAFFGFDLPSGLGMAFFEAGYSALRTHRTPFTGVHIIGGYRLGPVLD
jgi:hypothetical protein